MLRTPGQRIAVLHLRCMNYLTGDRSRSESSLEQQSGGDYRQNDWPEQASVGFPNAKRFQSKAESYEKEKRAGDDAVKSPVPHEIRDASQPKRCEKHSELIGLAVQPKN